VKILSLEVDPCEQVAGNSGAMFERSAKRAGSTMRGQETSSTATTAQLLLGYSSAPGLVLITYHSGIAIVVLPAQSPSWAIRRPPPHFWKLAAGGRHWVRSEKR